MPPRLACACLSRQSRGHRCHGAAHLCTFALVTSQVPLNALLTTDVEPGALGTAHGAAGGAPQPLTGARLGAAGVASPGQRPFKTQSLVGRAPRPARPAGRARAAARRPRALQRGPGRRLMKGCCPAPPRGATDERRSAAGAPLEGARLPRGRPRSTRRPRRARCPAY